MATRSRTPRTPPPAQELAAAPKPALSQPAGGPSLGATPLRLREGRGPYTWMISAARLGCRHGRIVPMVVPAWHAPGIGANVRGDHGAGYIGQLRRQGYVEIPHDRLPCVAFGASRAGAKHSTYLERYEGVGADGRPVTQWVDAWQRPQQIGHLVVWETDDEGRDEFLAAALRDLACGGRDLTSAQVQLAIRPILARIRAEADRDTARSRRLIATMAGHLPAEHTPPDIRRLLERLEIEQRAAE